MQRPLSSSRLGIAISILLCILSIQPVHAKAQRSVAEWIAIGNAQIAQGRLGTALMIFGKIAARHPGFAPARDGLRNIFARLGSPRRSEAFLRYAMLEEPEHQKALLAAWQVLDRTYPLRFSGSASILPSSNIEHVASERYLVTSAGTFLIKEGGQETAGVGIGGALGVGWVIHPRPGHRFRLRAGLAAGWYDIPALRFAEGTLALGYEHLGGPIPWSLEWFTSRRRYGGTAQDLTPDNKAHGLTFAAAWRPARGSVLRLQLAGEYRTYSKKPYLTGPTYGLDLEIGSRLGAQGRLNYGLHLARGLPRTDYHRYTEVELHIGYDRRVFKGLRMGVSMGVGNRRYDANFPIVGERRHDRTLSLGLSATLTRARIFGQAPNVSCSWRKTRSNIALYSSNSFDCALALKLGF